MYLPIEKPHFILVIFFSFLSLFFLTLSTPDISYSHSLRWLKVCTPGHLLSHSLASVLGKVSDPFHNHNLSLTPLPHSSSLYTSYFETWDYSVARPTTCSHYLAWQISIIDLHKMTESYIKINKLSKQELICYLNDGH
uniref:Uncharacterized protein n=1 Tax=Cacopsylla melanoneura TaxID=428564 RepID=A0A8D8VLP2_9HEMI